MPNGCRGALWGLVVGLVVSALIVLFLMSDRPSHPVVGVATPWTVPVSATVDNEASAYASLQAYMRKEMKEPNLVFQDLEPGVVTLRQPDVWHFRFWFEVPGPKISAKNDKLRIQWDGDYQYLGAGDWRRL